MNSSPLAIALLFNASLLAGRAQAVDQTVVGAGNEAAARLASSSPLVRSARLLISRQIGRIDDFRLQSAIRDLVENPRACIRHRAGETAASKQAVIDKLTAAGLIAANDAAAFPGGALAGVLPPLADAGTPARTCPSRSSRRRAASSAVTIHIRAACPSTRASTTSATSASPPTTAACTGTRAPAGCPRFRSSTPKTTATWI